MLQPCPELAVSNVIECCVEETIYRKAHHLPPPTVGEVVKYFDKPGTPDQKRVCTLLFSNNTSEDWFMIDKGVYLAFRNTSTFARRVKLYPSP
jgi:hypothetical protein